MLTSDENGIKKNIKKSYRKKLLINFIYFFIIIFFTFSISFLCWIEIKKINFISILVFIVSGIIIFYYLHPLYLSFKRYINPKRYGILKKYPNISDIINEINNTIEYKDKKLVISTKYLIAKDDYTNLIFLGNLDRIYIAENTNGGRSFRQQILGYYLFFLELDGNKNYIYYDVDQKQEMYYVISILERKCPNIITGYTDNYICNKSLFASKNIDSDKVNSNPVYSIMTSEEKLDDIKLRSIVSQYEKNEEDYK